MTKIAVTCDSTISISLEKAKEYGIKVLPLNVIVDNVEYHDGVDIDSDKLAKMMRDGGVIKTSTPTPYEIELFFDSIFAEGYDRIIHFTISSKLSSMFALFTNICQEKYKNKVVVIDSKSVMSFMLANVLTAKELVKQGNLSVEEIVLKIQERLTDSEVVFIPESLTYLKRGGRVPPAVCLIGNLIGIKPVLAFVDGAIEKLGTTRNIKATLKEYANKFAEMKKDPDKYAISIASVDTNPAMVEYAKKLVCETLPDYEYSLDTLAVNVEAHTGPGTIALILYRKVNK